MPGSQLEGKGAAAVLTIAEAQARAAAALERAGAGPEQAASVAASLVVAEAEGLEGIGLAHLADYCDGLAKGRIDGRAEPLISRPAPAIIHSDAQNGFAHTGFDRAFGELVAAARAHGVALFAQTNGFSCGALGYFACRLADEGLVSLVAANAGPAVMAASGSTKPVFCTNPFAFGAPRKGGPPLVIDQSTSASAIVNLRLAAERGETIPEGWALDSDGRPTTDPAKALEGVLLAFGGARGANVALMVELLAAGLTGGNWSLDAPSFHEGDASPAVGMIVLAIDGDKVLGGDLAARVDAYLTRLEHDFGAYIPGKRRAENAARAAREGLSLKPAVAKLLGL